MLKITLTAGKVGKKETQLKVLQALGLRKYGSAVVRADSPTIRGMIDKVHHLVTVTEAEAGATTGKITRKARFECAQKEKAAAK
ncbi:MAG: 50S ribosomal protein L30 [Candidatus Obscuribacterales bacterium]|nr:50S ribosomal protein L30 [Candidatus Obscuribacterales bacterium]